jgi:hypothetical protein
MNEAEDILKSMGLTAEEVKAADDEVRSKGRRPNTDRTVCLCGHAMARHTIVNGVVFCKPSRMECPCKKSRAVLEVADVRKFLRSTSGGGKLHALTLGLLAHIETGKSAKWLIELQCDRCGKNDKNVVPVPVTQSGRSANYATGYDALLCKECRESI